MGRKFGVTAVMLTVVSVSTPAQDAKTIIANASRALGADGLTSITYSGSAAMGNFGQSRNISFRLASTSIRNYTRTIDFVKPMSRAIGDTRPPASEAGPVPEPGTYEQTITPDNQTWADQLQIWTTPWGFLRGAAAHHATVRSRKIEGTPYQVVTWSPVQKAPSGQPYRVTGYINAENMIDRVETWVEHPVLGDMHVEFIYTKYQDFDGLKAPTRISQKNTGMETFVVGINDARANPPDLSELLSVPPGDFQGAEGSPSRPPVASERLADGVYRITGGYVALAVEFHDHVVVLEGGQSEIWGLAIMGEVKRLIPNKRIKYVVNTHPHFDHVRGLPPFVAEGITIITDDNNKYFLEQALGSPRTLVGDALAKSRKKPKVEGVIDKLVLRDETRTIELHHVEELEHSDGMIIAFLPRERLLFTADFNVPLAGQPVSPSIATLVQNIERLQLDFDRHVMVHAPEPDRPMTKGDLLDLVNRTR